MSMLNNPALSTGVYLASVILGFAEGAAGTE